MKSATRFKVTSTVWKNTANRFPDPSRKRSSKSLYESASPSAVARRLCVPAPVAAPLPHTAAASRPTRLTGASVLSPRRHKGLPRTLSGLRLHSRSVPQSCSRTLHGCVRVPVAAPLCCLRCLLFKPVRPFPRYHTRLAVVDSPASCIQNPVSFSLLFSCHAGPNLLISPVCRCG